jgi:cytochrome c oxidase cbb3-type subunit I/II
MREPSSMSPGSIMPNYAWLLEQTLNTSQTQDKLAAMKKLGVPYSTDEIANAVKNLNTQAKAIQANLAAEKIKVSQDKEIIALIAYLQRLGTDISKK